VTPPTVLDIYRARLRLQRHLTRTPLRDSPSFGTSAGRRVLLKLESLNLTHSFKVRGAFNALLRLIETHPEPSSRPRVVTASAGNHGRAMAYAAQTLGIPLVVFAPTTAPKAKTEAIRRHGATLHLTTDYDAAEQQARTLAFDQGGVFISPYNHPDVVAGAGTIGLEVVEACPDAGTIVVPLGGGGLASGIGLAVRAMAPGIRIVGVEAEASTPFTTSLARGAITTIQAAPTLADGLAGNLETGSMTFPLVQQVVDEVVTVSERALVGAMRRMAADEHLIVEGSSAVAVAAIASGRIGGAPGPVVAIVTGANIDLETFLTAVAPARS
jgi:threonine dehydratase